MTSYPILSDATLSLSNISTEIYPIITSIRSEWNSTNTNLIIFNNGLSNITFGLFDTRLTNDESQGLVIKLFGTSSDLFIDRQSEIKTMIDLYNKGVISQRILIKFKNGIIYKYIPGRICLREDIFKENIAKLMATKLALFHSVPIEQTEKSFLIPALRKFVEILKNYEQPTTKEILDISADIDLIEKSVLPRLLSNTQIGNNLVLCHNDLVRNVIYDEKIENLSFIDFEYTHINYAFFDIANLFVQYADTDNEYIRIYPTRSQQKKWLTTYFEVRGLNEVIINDDLCYVIDQFAILSHLLMALDGFALLHLSKSKFDFLSYAQAKLNCYYKLKSNLFQS
ncbi:unnamed protein product [Adineta steineri]|uniref:ethanolamine kinase n=1 Tax=Adineta steineri TaxID=433720 RepID=A0A814LZS0_9BILA|nr:unnamed protein product [Adineta steineri]CAF3867790.1 unnamed protein product [Adineta steineri]